MENEDLNIDKIWKDCEIVQYKKMLAYLKKSGVELTNEEINEIEDSLMKDYGNNEPIRLKEFLSQF